MKKLVVLLLSTLSCFGCESNENNYIDCYFSYAPDPELYEMVSQAADRWANATGCLFAVSVNGDRRVQMVPSVIFEGKEYSAGTFDGGYTIEISRRSSNIMRSIMHEMGHSLGMTGHNSGHGVLSYHSDYSDVIDEQSLADVCKRIHCQDFKTEEQP